MYNFNLLNNMTDSVIYYEWFYGVYQIPLALATLWLLWVLVHIQHKRKIFGESLVLFNKFWHDIYRVDEDNNKCLLPLLKYLRVLRPHSIVSSLKQFEMLFKKCLLTVDRQKRLFPLKSELLYIYGNVHDKIVSFSMKNTFENNRRRFIRYANVESIYYIDSSNKSPNEGLLINIGGGGARFFTKKQVKKGQKVKILFDKNTLNLISAKILDVIKKTDFYIVRVKFPLAYPHV